MIFYTRKRNFQLINSVNFNIINYILAIWFNSSNQARVSVMQKETKKDRSTIAVVYIYKYVCCV
jgi:hypothetical protein